MSGTSTDPVADFVLSLLALVGLVLILPLILAFYGLAFAGRRARELGERRQLLGHVVREEHRRIAHERSAAIRDIVAIRQRSEHELRELAHGRGDRA
jgi:biopolymer transport protein ExbB/TolQ